MSEDKSSRRATLATIIATAAVTVAVGVTAAALGGYLVPARDQASRSAAAPGPSESLDAIEPQPTAPPNLVLVPVAPDLPAANPVEPEPAPALVLASHETREREEHRGRDRGHHEEPDDGDDHDDD